ncbi:hypothetical protein HUS85_33115 [Pseudomonas protegens]|uniref:hypothetical protein n=1 Tax=Pseudomonas protegens TaxID=380021 RepID=UPI001B3225DD|nr:hypothetical protein [Pseudomonas protegens]MBP5120659.1 hypothetical protein [Pseudomonas protegens]
MNEIIKPLFYGKMAYNSNDIPEQPALGERGWLLKFSGVRLPWGRTQDVSPHELIQDPKPERSRFWESVE